MAGNISRENGRKGGRKKGIASILAEKAHAFIAQELDRNLKPIVAKAVRDAKGGDRYAREWLSERGLGKVPQAVIPTDPEGNALPITYINVSPIKK